MKSKGLIGLIGLLALSILSGCYANMRFYPVTGPLSARTPLPVFTAKVTTGNKSGDISLVLADGETCSGTWTRIRTSQGPGGESLSNGANGEMASVWDAIYGQGFYVSHVLGIYDHGAARIVGDRGTVLAVEFMSDEHGRKGVAKDSQGNIYKIVF